MKKSMVAICILFVIAIANVPDKLLGDTETQGGEQTGVRVHEVFYKKQNKYDVSTDVHFKLWQEEDNINMNGWKVKISKYTDSDSQRGNQPTTAHGQVKNMSGLPPTDDPDNGQHAADVTATGNVNRGTWVRIEAYFWLTDWNTKRLADLNWTGSEAIKAIPDFGWTIGWPEQVGEGEYQHVITITNDDANDAFILNDLKFYATTDPIPIEDLNSISFPIELPNEPNLNPGDSWAYNLTTPGDYVGGHIYGYFKVQDAEDLSDAEDSPNALVDIFDHPITTLPEGACAMPDGTCMETTWADCESAGGVYQGDGTTCQSDIPTVTEWGMIVMTLGLLTVGVVVIMRRQPVTA